MSKQELLAKFIDKLIPDVFFKYIGQLFRSNNKLIVLAYHRIMEFDENFPFDIELISARPQQFEKQIKHISKYYSPITIEELCECHRTKSKIPDRSVLITFDDGFYDNYEYAFPVLKKYNVPATIFVSTDYIDSNTTFWFDKLAYLVLNKDLVISESNLLYDIVKNKTHNSRRCILEQCLELIKQVPDSTRINSLNDLYESNQDALNDMPYKEYSSTLSSENILEMNNSVISFGSHTKSHPILTQLNESEKLKEMTGSKNTLEQLLKTRIDTIAYPVGTESAYNKSVINNSIKAGYELGFTYVHGVNNWPLDQSFTIKRLHVEQYTSSQFFKCMLSMPQLFKY